MTLPTSLVRAVGFGLFVLQWACAGTSPPPPPPGPPPLVLQEDRSASPAREAEAEALLARGWDTWEAGRAEEAFELADEVASRYPATRVSGPSLLLRARAARARGRAAEAEAAIERYRSLLPPGDPRQGELAVLDAEARLDEGGEEALASAAASLLEVTADAPEATKGRAVAVARELAPRLDAERLSGALAEAVIGRPVAPVFMVAHARLLLEGGELDAARRSAEVARDRGRAPEAEAAEDVLSILDGAVAGRPAWEVAPISLGALLPLESSPGVSEYARKIAEGIRTALATVDSDALTLELLDNGSDPLVAENALRTLEDRGVVAVIGPLEDALLGTAARARSTPIPLISPTALSAGQAEAVLTLGGPDPGAARALARYAWEGDLRQVVVLHPEGREHGSEAAAFREAFLELGGSVLRILTYPRGTTYFQEELATVRHLEPQALFLPVPPEDVEALAPQVSFFGLDSLGIRVLGNASWTRPEVLRTVAPRHTNGVVAASPDGADGEGEGYQRFQEAYEALHARSLRDRVPALGYDAASLVLEALRSGATAPRALRDALETVDGFEGATGVLSVEDGRIVRRHHLVCLQDQALRPVEPGEVPRAYRPERPGDPEEDEPEVVALGPLEVYCPGIPIPGLDDGEGELGRESGRRTPSP